MDVQSCRRTTVFINCNNTNGARHIGKKEESDIPAIDAASNKERISFSIGFLRKFGCFVSWGRM